VSGEVRFSSTGFCACILAAVAIVRAQCLERQCNWSEDHRDQQRQSGKSPDSFTECSSSCVAQSHVRILSLDVRTAKFLPLSSMLLGDHPALLG
jgi:hypothetical protein